MVYHTVGINTIYNSLSPYNKALATAVTIQFCNLGLFSRTLKFKCFCTCVKWDPSFCRKKINCKYMKSKVNINNKPQEDMAGTATG